MGGGVEAGSITSVASTGGRGSLEMSVRYHRRTTIPTSILKLINCPISLEVRASLRCVQTSLACIAADHHALIGRRLLNEEARSMAWRRLDLNLADSTQIQYVKEACCHFRENVSSSQCIPLKCPAVLVTFECFKQASIWKATVSLRSCSTTHPSDTHHC